MQGSFVRRLTYPDPRKISPAHFRIGRVADSYGDFQNTLLCGSASPSQTVPPGPSRLVYVAGRAISRPYGHPVEQAYRDSAIASQPIVYFTVDDARPGVVFGVRGKAHATLDLDATRIRDVVQAQCDRYAEARDSTTHRFLFGMVERGELLLAVLRPHSLATWGL